MPWRTTLGRIYFVSAANTTIATTTLNTWVIFPANPATVTPIRNSGHFSVNAGGNRITNISNKTMWVRVDISFQINNATNASLVSYEFQWRLTGVAFGQIYRSASGSIATNSQSTIISGFGYIQMAPGAYIEPFVRNTEDNSNTTITTCSIAVTEDSDAVVQ
jgi:hypothetical protein